MHTAQELQRLAQMIDSVSDAIVTINSRGVIEYVNQGALDLFGYAREELLGQNVALLMGQPERSRHDHYIHAYLATGQSRVMNHRRSVDGLRKNGSVVPLDLNLGQMLENGQRKFTAVMRDVTQQRRLQQLASEAEQRLQEAKERADEANRAKSIFLATMSHEIRTPMNGVLGALELLGLTQLDPSQRDTVAMVEQSARELLQILDDILDFSKIEAGHLQLRLQGVVVREQIIDKVIATFAPLASKKGLHLHSRVAGAVAGQVCVDPLRLRQILNNFVSNAVKFTAAGSVELSLDLIEARGGRQTLRFAVRDTGIGISAANQARLFKPFVQAEGDTTRRFGGTGLGLAICLGLADSMGGTLNMQSAPGEGTTMSLTITLPALADGQAAAATAAATKATATAVPHLAPTYRILVADDHATNRSVLLRQLNTLGYAADSCANGIEALSLLASGRYQLLISDCQMPEMDGYSLAQTIRAQERRNGDAPLPIIAFTANAFASDAARALAAGMDDYLTKPTTMKALADMLAKHLHTPSPLDESVLAAIIGDDRTARAELLEDFRSGSLLDAAMLRQAWHTSDMPGLIVAAHRIAGASRMIGAGRLAAAAAALERAARSGALAAPATYAQLESELANLATYLTSAHEH